MCPTPLYASFMEPEEKDLVLHSGIRGGFEAEETLRGRGEARAQWKELLHLRAQWSLCDVRDPRSDEYKLYIYICIVCVYVLYIILYIYT